MTEYSKAFNTIDHEFLFRKLVSLNFSSSSIKIILSYLTNQKQYLQVNDKQSTWLPICLGFPQHSILDLVLLNYQYALNLTHFSMQMTLTYESQVQKQIQY